MASLHNRNPLLADTSGVALLEFALVLPILMLLVYGTLELSRFAIAHQKVDKTVFSMSDLVTQCNSITKDDIKGYGKAANTIMSPFSFTGTVIFTSITGADPRQPATTCGLSSGNCINWQEKTGGEHGGGGDESKLGTPGSNAKMPNGYNVPAGQDVIVVEMYYNYEPLMNFSRDMLQSLSSPTTVLTYKGILLYKTALYKPRQSKLNTLSTISCNAPGA